MSALKRVVYRVENAQGEGPYRAELTRSLPASLSYPYDHNRPSPVIDGLKYPPWPAEYSTFAFANKEQVIKWFGDAKRGRWLSKYGYYLTTYEILEDKPYSTFETPHQFVFDCRLNKKLISRELIKYPETFADLRASN